MLCLWSLFNNIIYNRQETAKYNPAAPLRAELHDARWRQPTCSSLVYSWKHCASEQVWGCMCCSFTWRTLSASGMYSSSVLLNRLRGSSQHKAYRHHRDDISPLLCAFLFEQQLKGRKKNNMREIKCRRGRIVLTSLLSLCPIPQQFWHEEALRDHKTWMPCWKLDLESPWLYTYFHFRPY